MDTALIILSFILILAGFAGSILPALPGPPLAYLGLLITFFTSYRPLGPGWLVAYAVMVLAMALCDWWLPALAIRLTKGSRNGIRGANIGMIAGLFIPLPFGIFIGALLGSFVGELVEGKSRRQALTASFGVFISMIGGIFMKCMLCLAMLLHLAFALVFRGSDAGTLALLNQL